MMGIRLMNVK